MTRLPTQLRVAIDAALDTLPFSRLQRIVDEMLRHESPTDTEAAQIEDPAALPVDPLARAEALRALGRLPATASRSGESVT